jgi:hypothetical protein
VVWGKGSPKKLVGISTPQHHKTELSMKRFATTLLTIAFATSASAQRQTPAQSPLQSQAQSQGGSMPLEAVLAVAKPYPNLLLQVRLQLVRANLKRDAVTCGAGRYDARWTQLSGARLAPYECKIGRQTLVISAAQTFYDRNGKRLAPGDVTTPAKAAKVKESGLKWSWK